VNVTTALRADGADALRNAATRMLPIGETGKYINGVAFKPTDWSDEGLPIVRIQNLTDRTKPMNRTMRVVDPAYVVQPGDLLVSWSATLDAFIWEREPALLNQHIFKVVPNTDLVSKKYLFFALRHAIVEMGRTEHLHGSTMKHINRGPFLAHRIPVPPLRAQAEIVAELEKQFSRLDEAVANLKRSTANLLAYKQAAVREAIWGDRSVAASVEDLPPGWSLTALSELGELRRGKSKHRPRDDPKLYGGPYPFIQTGDVRRSAGVIREYTQTYSEFGLQQSRLWPAGTLCITIAANIAETGILAAPACFPDSVVGFVSADGTLVRYVELFFRTIRADLERFAPATAQKNINLSILERVQVPLPPASDRERIVAEVDRRLSIVREVEVQVEATQRRAASLKSSCLAASFSAARKREAPDQLEKREEASD
jgi:type I restriction enzyme S subunit